MKKIMILLLSLALAFTMTACGGNSSSESPAPSSVPTEESKAPSGETEKEEVKCKRCDYGCDFELLKANGKVLGVRAKAPGGGRPLCLKGKLSLDLLYTDSPSAPLIKKDGEYVEVTWAEALEMEDLLKKLGQSQNE